MAIKLAFSTVACPEWTIEEAARRAQEMGYQGLELRTLGAGSTQLAGEPALTEPKKISAVCRAFGVEPVCLSTSVALHHRDTTAAHKAAWEARQYLEMAAEIGCPFVRIFGYEVEPGHNRQSVLSRIAERTIPIAERAGELGVQVLFENAGSFNTAKEWWWLFNLVEHPLVGLCWNVANAAAAGEPPSISVPTLNSRIRLAKVKDTIVGEGSGFVPLGEGTVGVEQFIRRLLGIGYDGYVSVEWDRAWLPALAPAEEYLPDAQQRLRGWLDAIAANQAPNKPHESSGTPAGKPAKKPAAAAK